MATSKAADDRPDPDALLNAAIAEGRGKLKVFLGAAPGVGKTYAMLSAAQQLAREGGDVLIGVVETHGRADTQALIQGLDILPRKTIDYRGHTVEEFDLDAALARRPGLIIVDELAHTPTRPKAVIRSGIRTSKNCCAPASTSGRPSISSIWRTYRM